MTDDQLKDKILRQLTAKGLTGTVTVVGDHIEIRAERHLSPSSSSASRWRGGVCNGRPDRG